MDDDLPLPRQVPHNALPSSPPPFPLLNRRYRTTSPTSSEPPLFSSDGPEAADVTNYESPRNKKKRAGPWWSTPRDQPLERSKKTKISRNFDSGVYMMSDGSSFSVDLSSDPPQPLEAEQNAGLAAEETFAERLDREVSHMTEGEGRLYRHIIETMESNVDHIYDFEGFGLVDEDTKHLSLLKQVIYHPPDASVEIPSEGQYRSFIPKLRINLGRNSLRALPPSLFQVDNIEYLSLRDNQISELPPQIGKLTTLHHLDLTRNNIKYLPVEILHVLHNENTSFRWDYSFNPLPTGRSSFLLPTLGNPLFHPCIRRPEMGYSMAPVSDSLQSAWNAKREEVKDPSYKRASHHKHCPDTQIQIPKILDWSLDTQQHHDAFKGPHLVMNGWSLVRYYEENGRLLAGCPTWPDPPRGTNERVPIDAIVSTKDKGASGVPPTWFSPPSESTVPSLRSACLSTALKELESPAEVERYLGDSITPNIKRQLDCAAINQDLVHSTMRECHVCGRDYIVPRAEWLEFWMHSMIECVPVMVRVCSWGCVPKFIRDRPERIWEDDDE